MVRKLGSHPSDPVFVVALFAYGVATMFIGIYEMTIDTIFMAFCEDSERKIESEQ